MTLGNKLQQIRKTLDYTAGAFAEKLGISPHTYGTYERNTSKAPFDFIFKLIITFNVNINYLTDESDVMFKKTMNTLDLHYDELNFSTYDFGKRVNKIRVSADLISNQMAEILSLSELEFANICTGKEKPTIELLKKLCENFNVTSDWLLFGVES